MKHPYLLLALLFNILSANAGDIVLPAVAASIKFTNPVVASNMSFGIETNVSGEGYTEITTVDGIPCRKIPAGKFMYVNCNRTAVPTTAKKIILSITYYDNSMSYLWLNFTRNGTGWGGADFKKSNTKKWITRLVILNDAGFDGTMGYGGDIRMGFGSEDNYIKDITVYVGALTPDAQPIPAKPANPTEFKGKSYAGYQLWHEAGPQDKDWVHWAYGKPPAAGRGNHNTETFPNIADYQNNPNVSMYQTNYANLGNGSPAKLYNATDKAVIDVQMSLLGKAGFDGVAIQRNAPVGKDLKYTSTDDYYVSIKNACEANGRSFYVMYCMPDQNNGAGLTADLVDGIKRDWVYQMEQIYALTSSSSYATVNGKPVVELWGLGYSTITVDRTQALQLAQFFKDRGCYVIAGVPRDWRLMNGGSRTDFADVYKAYNMISPWTVGVYSDTVGANSFRTEYMIPDKQYCEQNGMDFYPVIFPGSAWSQHVSGYPNDTKRLGGQFLWKQARNIKSLGIQSMYFAMLDEFEESTNIINEATDYFDIPTDQYFGTSSMDGIWTSPDYYLRLAGAAARMLTSPVTPVEIPIPYSNGPIYYRNSFESRVANCIIDNVARDIISPIDACFYKNALLSGTSPVNVAIVNAAAFSRSGTYTVKVDGTSTGNAYYKISETKIKVKADMQLSFWKYTVNEPGKYTSVDLSFKSGKLLRNLSAYKDNNGIVMNPAIPRGTTGAWQKFTCQIGKGELIGDEINGIIIGYNNASLSGNFTAYFDDIIIEDAADTSSNKPKAPIGSHISLANGGFYVSSENGIAAMNCNRESAGAWESFEVVDAGNGSIALKGNNGLYVNAASPMFCNGTVINANTTFNWLELPDNAIALQSTAGTYICSENGTTAMNCNRAAIGGWETFNWNTLSSARMAYTEKETASSLNTALKIYPNPASSYVIVSYELKKAAPLLLEIANMHGAVVKSARINSPAGLQRMNITLADLTSGIYMVRIVANGTVETKKLVVY